MNDLYHGVEFICDYIDDLSIKKRRLEEYCTEIRINSKYTKQKKA